ncbi:hypothetical protein BGLA2_780040 [Burkholderia gladioli]|nr:hypothetical protein BGLA2_780040 [Burkholderia gladioli]
MYEGEMGHRKYNSPLQTKLCQSHISDADKSPSIG